MSKFAFLHWCCFALHRRFDDLVFVLTCSDSDDEDETAALMAELAKIKQERAEEKARQVSAISCRYIDHPTASSLSFVL